MNPETLGFASFAVSLVALAISTVFAIRQTRLTQNSSQLPIFLQFFRELGTTNLHIKEITLWEELAALDPSLGFSELPEPTRSHAYNVANYYLMLAYLVAFELVDERMALLPVYFRLQKTWGLMKPFVEQERRWRGVDSSFLNTVEALVEKIESPQMQMRLNEVQRNLFE